MTSYLVQLNAFIQNGPTKGHGFTEKYAVSIAAETESEAIHRAFSQLADELEDDQSITDIYPSARAE